MEKNPVLKQCTLYLLGKLRTTSDNAITRIHLDPAFLEE